MNAVTGDDFYDGVGVGGRGRKGSGRRVGIREGRKGVGLGNFDGRMGRASGRGMKLHGARRQGIGNTKIAQVQLHPAVHRHQFSSAGCVQLTRGVASWKKARGEGGIVGMMPPPLAEDAFVCLKAVGHLVECHLQFHA